MKPVSLAERSLTLMVACLAVIVVAVSGCGASGPGKGAEAVARAWIDAMNARDEDKAVALWAEERRESAGSVYEAYILGDRKYATKSLSGEASPIDPERFYDVTAVVVEESGAGKRDVTFEFGLELRDGQWYILMFGAR